MDGRMGGATDSATHDTDSEMVEWYNNDTTKQRMTRNNNR
jgi:hypothetical protein